MQQEAWDLETVENYGIIRKEIIILPPINTEDTQNLEIEKPINDRDIQTIVKPVLQFDYTDITPYLHMPQGEAAKVLGMPSSTLSKRWREAVGAKRKWPHRAVLVIERELASLLQNYKIDDQSERQIPEEIKEKICQLCRDYHRLLFPAKIRV